MNYSDHIEIVSGKRGGKPCIKGTRISVYDVLGWLANGMSPTEITEDFPEIQIENIMACLAYAAARENQRLAIAV